MRPHSNPNIGEIFLFTFFFLKWEKDEMGKKKKHGITLNYFKSILFQLPCTLLWIWASLVVQMVKCLPAMQETVNIGTYILTSSPYILSFSILQCDLLLNTFGSMCQCVNLLFWKQFQRPFLTTWSSYHVIFPCSMLNEFTQFPHLDKKIRESKK